MSHRGLRLGAHLTGDSGEGEVCCKPDTKHLHFEGRLILFEQNGSRILVKKIVSFLPTRFKRPALFEHEGRVRAGQPLMLVHGIHRF